MTVPFPGYADPVDVLTLRQAVESAIAAHTQAGFASGSIPAGETSVDIPVVFSPPFTTSPAIGLGVRVVSAGGYTASIVAKSLSGFTIRVYRPAGTSPTSIPNVNIDWIATDLVNED